jgi:hypothetical protein
VITFSELGQWGRLGNQLYEYAALLGIGRELGFDVAIPPLDQHELGSCFEIRAPILTRRDRRHIRHRLHEPRIGYSPRYRDIDDFTDLTGYFQSPRYFPDRAALKQELVFRPELLDAGAAAVERHRVHGQPVVGVTVRRGDYLLHPHQFVQLWATDFYDRAFSFVTEKVGDDVVFLVSSDDPSWCRDHFTDPRVVVVDGVADQAQLAMLTLCDHLVLANSSFAWWAAWLSDVADLRVASATWWGQDCDAPESDRDPLPAGWTELAIDTGA